MGHYGIVYIARNDQHPPNVYKIGGSSRDVDERMRELSNETATYGTFEAKAFFPVTDWERAEAECHRQLYENREDKEFFKAPYNELVDVVRNVCDGYQPEAHADEPTDGMSKALFLKQASPAHPDSQIINCENCGEKLRVPNRLVKVTCPHCDYTFQSEGVSTPQSEKQATSAPQYVPPEQPTDHPDDEPWFRDKDYLRGVGKVWLGVALFYTALVVILKMYAKYNN